MADFVLKKGDLLPTFDLQLLDDNVAIDLSSGVDSVKFYLRNSDGVLKIDGGSMSFIGTGSDGKIRYTWTGTDTDTVGNYVAEVIVVWTTGMKPQTFPNNKNLNIEIFDDVQ